MIKSIFCFLLYSVLAQGQMTFYGENGQDKYVYEHFFINNPAGFFIDIGAHEGILYSNTCFFENQLKWKGICFEPNPVSYEKLIRNRNSVCLQKCISNEKGMKQFVSHPTSWVSGLLDKYSEQHAKKWGVQNVIADHSAQVISVDCCLLNDILEQYKIYEVDFLSIDTEGGELEILKSIDYSKYNIKVIVVENIYHDFEYRCFLESQGYVYATRLYRDEIYYKIK